MLCRMTSPVLVDCAAGHEAMHLHGGVKLKHTVNPIHANAVWLFARCLGKDFPFVLGKCTCIQFHYARMYVCMYEILMIYIISILFLDNWQICILQQKAQQWLPRRTWSQRCTATEISEGMSSYQRNWLDVLIMDKPQETYLQFVAKSTVKTLILFITSLQVKLPQSCPGRTALLLVGNSS